MGHSLQIVRSAARSSTTRNFFAWPARLSVAIYTRVGPHRALELGLLGETISAEEAVRIGLASRSVPADAWRSTVDDMALRLATGFNRNLALRKLGLYERARAGPGLCARYKIARRHRPHGCNVREPGMETYKHSSSKSDGTPNIGTPIRCVSGPFTQVYSQNSVSNSNFCRRIANLACRGASRAAARGDWSNVRNPVHFIRPAYECV